MDTATLYQGGCRPLQCHKRRHQAGFYFVQGKPEPYRDPVVRKPVPSQFQHVPGHGIECRKRRPVAPTDIGDSFDYPHHVAFHTPFADAHFSRDNGIVLAFDPVRHEHDQRRLGQAFEHPPHDRKPVHILRHAGSIDTLRHPISPSPSAAPGGKSGVGGGAPTGPASRAGPAPEGLEQSGRPATRVAGSARPDQRQSDPHTPRRSRIRQTSSGRRSDGFFPS